MLAGAVAPQPVLVVAGAVEKDSADEPAGVAVEDAPVEVVDEDGDLVRRRCCSCSPSLEALHDASCDTSITVAALMPSVRGTNFFHRAKMDDTPAAGCLKTILRMWRRAASMP